MWLKIFHAIGLTNLSDEQVRQYLALSEKKKRRILRVAYSRSSLVDVPIFVALAMVAVILFSTGFFAAPSTVFNMALLIFSLLAAVIMCSIGTRFFQYLRDRVSLFLVVPLIVLVILWFILHLLL